MHPPALKEVCEDEKESKREQQPGPGSFADAANGVESCEDENYEQGEADVAHVQPRIQIPVMGGWHVLDPAGSVNDAGSIGPYEPEGLISPSEERTACYLGIHKVPYNCPVC